MPWRGNPNDHAGFSTETPWLPIGVDHLGLAVDRQNGDPASLLNLTRRLIAFRRASEALTTGDVTVLAVTDSLLAFERSAGTESAVVRVQPGSRAGRMGNPLDPTRWRMVESVGAIDGWAVGRLRGSYRDKSLRE